MKIKYPLILALLVSFFSFSQTENENYKEVALRFKSLYNKGDYEAIYNMFDSAMKKALPLDKTKTFFNQNVKIPYGNIEQMEFYKLKQTAHIYKSKFERSTLNIMISLNEELKINGFFISPFKPDNLAIIKRNSAKISLPFEEEWFVFWGGETVENNYHVAYENQKYAYDLMILKNGTSFNGEPKKNESYYVFGKEVKSPCKAKVVKIITGVKDNVPGELNPAQLTGNTIILEIGKNEYLLFAHLKENSIVVKKGQIINKGDLLGLCGNSGNTTEPHLHLSLQNVIDMNIATGAKLFFDKILVNGKIKEDYLPVKGDKIQNIN